MSLTAATGQTGKATKTAVPSETKKRPGHDPGHSNLPCANSQFISALTLAMPFSTKVR